MRKTITKAMKTQGMCCIVSVNDITAHAEMDFNTLSVCCHIPICNQDAFESLTLRMSNTNCDGTNTLGMEEEDNVLEVLSN